MADKTITIRRAGQGDAVALFKLLQAAYSDARCPYPSYDDDALMGWIVATISDGEVWVADLSGRVVGSVALVVHTFAWSREPCLTNAWLYILDNFRARGTGTALLKAVLESADAHEAALVIGTHSGSDVATADAFLKAVPGMQYAGATFFRAPGAGALSDSSDSDAEADHG